VGFSLVFDLVTKPDWGDGGGAVNLSAFKLLGGLRFRF